MIKVVCISVGKIVNTIGYNLKSFLFSPFLSGLERTDFIKTNFLFFAFLSYSLLLKLPNKRKLTLSFPFSPN